LFSLTVEGEEWREDAANIKAPLVAGLLKEGLSLY
jgi:hypothetical protein